jgi:hypothetical protein
MRGSLYIQFNPASRMFSLGKSTLSSKNQPFLLDTPRRVDA